MYQVVPARLWLNTRTGGQALQHPKPQGSDWRLDLEGWTVASAFYSFRPWPTRKEAEDFATRNNLIESQSCDTLLLRSASSAASAPISVETI